VSSSAVTGNRIGNLVFNPKVGPILAHQPIQPQTTLVSAQAPPMSPFHERCLSTGGSSFSP